MRQQVVKEWLIIQCNIQSKLKTWISQIVSPPLRLYYVDLFLVSGHFCFDTDQIIIFILTKYNY